MKKAHGKRMFSVFVLVFAVALSGSAALADFYVIAVGKRAKRTILVSPQSTPGASGTALLKALNGITDVSESNPYLIIIEPGVYDIGGNTLQMKSYVDIQGSGENVTKITGNIDGYYVGVVEGADNAELRFLTVENTGGGTSANAIYNGGGSPKMTHVTATASGGTSSNHGVVNAFSSPKMTHVTATASGGTFNRGVLNFNCPFPPMMTNVTATASGGTYSRGVSNYLSSPTMTDVTATALEGSIDYGVYNTPSSSPAIRRSTMEGDTYSLYTIDGTATVSQCTLIGGVFGGTNNKCVACDNVNGTALEDDCLPPPIIISTQGAHISKQTASIG